MAQANKDLIQYQFNSPAVAKLTQFHILTCSEVQGLKIICLCIGAISFATLVYMTYIAKYAFLPIIPPQYILIITLVLNTIKMSLYCSLLYLCPWPDNTIEKWLKTMTIVLGASFNSMYISLFTMMACVDNISRDQVPLGNHPHLRLYSSAASHSLGLGLAA